MTGAGPRPNTVRDPAAIWVLPASSTKKAGIPLLAARSKISSISSSLGHLTAIFAHPVFSQAESAPGQCLCARLKHPTAACPHWAAIFPAIIICGVMIRYQVSRASAREQFYETDYCHFNKKDVPSMLCSSLYCGKSSSCWCKDFIFPYDMVVQVLLCT